VSRPEGRPYQPSAEERAWIVRELATDPRRTERMLLSLLKARHDRAEAKERERRDADAAGVTLAAWRQAKGERRRAEREAMYQRDLDRARWAVGLGVDPLADSDWETVRHAWREWTSRDGNAGARMDKAEWLAESRMGRDRFDAALRRHGVRDVRHLPATLKREGT
jgi:hypothetical protein